MASEPSDDNDSTLENAFQYDRQSESTRSNTEFDESRADHIGDQEDFGERDFKPDHDDEFEDELDAEFSSKSGVNRNRKRRKLHCFGCNRQEGHYLSQQGRWFYSYMIGLTFGLMRLIGPFRCQCCGSQRLMWTDKANLRYLFRGDSPNSKKGSSRSSSRKSKSGRSNRN